MNPVLAETRGNILVLTLNRPEVRNAMDLAAARCLEERLDAFEANNELRVAILTGGPSFFCAGTDLKAASDGSRPITARRGWFGLVRQPPAKPLIAAVEGPAYGGGFEIALACDLIVASRISRFALPEASRGLVAAAGGLIRLPRKIPPALAAEIAFTGEPVTAERLYVLGLVNRICDAGRTLAIAMTLAEKVAAAAPLSIEATKRVLALCNTLAESESWEQQEIEFAPVRASQDTQEGLKAFLEKRAPVWRGK
jgi:acetyl-CoA C-acetyltransferase